MKPSLLLRDRRQTTRCSGHLTDYTCYGRISQGKRSSRILRTLHRDIIVRNLPLGRHGQRLFDVFFINPQGVRCKAVEHDFELGCRYREPKAQIAPNYVWSGVWKENWNPDG